MTSATRPVQFLVGGHETLLRFGCKRNFVPHYGIRESNEALKLSFARVFFVKLESAIA
jgi:hypothetical protein